MRPDAGLAVRRPGDRVASGGRVMRADLSAVFRPASIAVVGASDRDGSRGAELLANLRSIGYSGMIYPVNPGRATVGGLLAYPRLSDIPGPIDAVAVGVDQATTRAVVAEAVGLGVQAVLVLGIGYAEAGDEGRCVQDELVAMCRAAGVRLIGPNSLGVWSRLDRVSYWLAPGSPLPLSGIALISQSGALASTLIEPLSYRGIALDAVAATGNEADVGAGDFLQCFAEDARLRVIGLIAESLRSPAAVLAAARTAWARGIPVVCLLTGTSRAGRDAALAHSAALLGDAHVARAALEQAGCLVVEDLAELTEALVLFSSCPGGLRAGLAVATVSGGGAGVVADVAETVGVELAALDAETVKELSTLLAGRRVANPVDVALAGDVPGVYDVAAAALAADPGVGTLAIGLNLPHAADAVGSRFYADQVRAATRARAAGADVVAFSFVPGEPDAALRTAATELGVPLLLGMREALKAIAVALAFRAAPTEPADPGPAAPTLWNGDPAAWDECEIRGVLSAYGVPVAAERRVRSAAEALAAGREIGYPVVLRILAPGLTHKSELGAVRVALADADALAAAYAQLEVVAEHLTEVTPRGMSVQAMAPAGGELVLGSRLEPGLGRALIFGWGGVWVEAFGRPQLALLPLSARDAWGLIERQFGSALDRARELADLDGLHSAVLSFATALAGLPDAVDTLEVNPLIVSFGGGGGGGVVAVDAAIALTAPARPAGPLVAS